MAVARASYLAARYPLRDYDSGLGAEHRRVEQRRPASPEQLRWPPTLTGRGAARRHEETGSSRDLAVKVPGVEDHTPDRLVHPTQLADGELRRAEGRRQSRILDLGPCSFDTIGKNLLMVESQGRGLLRTS